MFRSKLVVAILLILATVLVGCSDPTVIASPTIKVLPTEEPTATQVPPTATQEPTSTPTATVTATPVPMEFEAALELVSQDCREFPELKSLPFGVDEWTAVDPEKVMQYSIELFEQIESGLPVPASDTATIMWHYVPNTSFCWAFAFSSDEIEEQFLFYETEAGKTVVLRFNEEPVVGLDEDPMGLEEGLELVSQDCREIPELEAFSEKLAQYGSGLIWQVISELGLPPSTSYIVEEDHYIPSTSFCWAFAFSPDGIEEQFLVYETEAGDTVALPIWTWYSRMGKIVAQDCQELYDFEGNVIDEKPLGIGDLLMRSGFMKAGGREPDWESWYIRTDVGECLAVEVTDDTGARFVVYKAKDGEVKTLKIEE